MTTNYTRTFVASGAIGGRRFAKYGADDTLMAKATAAADLIMGVTERIDAADGERVDVVLSGPAEVVLGDTVTRGQYLTADADGAAVPCAPGAGTKAQYGAKALQSGVVGDFIEVMVERGQLTTPA
ncbi:MAG: hypothetical protein WDN08_05335 [Rhizomicrobium sp.]